MQITLRIRLRDNCNARLLRQARAVNLVWNYCNETQQKAAQAGRKWLHGGELMRLTSGSGKYLGLHSHTIVKVCSQYDLSRSHAKKPWLRWRGRKSLGWVPFNTIHVKFDGKAFVFHKHRYEPMYQDKRLVPGMRFGAGSFNADARGHWYINVPVEVDCAEPKPEKAVGIDLGLKVLATLSTGGKIEMPRFYRESEKALATAQRARKSRRAKAIHAKVRDRRKDFLHKASTALAQEYGTIVVGDMRPSKMAKTRLAKSVHDAGWAIFKYMLSYKSMRNGGRMVEVNEAYSSQVCSACGSIPPSRPKGIAGLGIREWSCDDCGAVHDRDRNGAMNILRVGLDTLVAGAPYLRSGDEPRLRARGVAIASADVEDHKIRATRTDITASSR